ncbi:DEAD/DEAH box helicase [Acholeplasma granularum]|uniref:DEAD/DEAH box helicase n=1 Tax=Acholeplasma granularum TaxID=264635 RepID=UPI0004AE1F0D|nr:DEAD/DEAH box helicase [Acholeplasma granularum]
MNIKQMLEKLNYESLSPIQEAVIDKFYEPKHFVGLAPTGTGKTHAYLFPILENIKRNPNEVEAIILLPTNELVLQVEQMLVNTDGEVSYKAYYGSMDMDREAKRLGNSHPNIVITTPSKLIDLVIHKNALNIKHTKYFILDEADMMFDEDFMNLIDPVLTNQKIDKFLLFSASMTKQMEPFISKYFGNYTFIDTTKDTVLNIDQYLLKVRDNRLESLNDVMKRINPYLGLIFVSKNEDIKTVYEYLHDKGYNVISFQSALGVKQRKRILEDIHNLKYQYVVSSDLLARGIDFKASHIIHYDLPYKLEFFLHRSGRTGRMGDSGEVYTLYDEFDQNKVDKLKNKGVEFVTVTLTPDGFKKPKKKSKTYDKKIANAIKKIGRPKKVTPGYKKKHAAKVKAAIKKIKKGRYRDADLRKSRQSKGE